MTSRNPASSVAASKEIVEIEQLLHAIPPLDEASAALASCERKLTALTARRREAFETIENAKERLKLVRRRAIRSAQNLYRRAVESLNDDAVSFAREVSSLPPALWSSWKAVAWDAYATAPVGGAVDNILVGHVPEIDEFFDGESGIAEVPVTRPLLGATGALLLLCDEKTRETARNLLCSIVLRAALAMPAELQLALLDPIGLGAAFPFYGKLPRVRPAGRTAAEVLWDVQNDIERIMAEVHFGGLLFRDLSEEQRRGWINEIVAAVDFPQAYAKDPRVLDKLVLLANSGPRAGRHLLLEVRLDMPMPRKIELDCFVDPIIIDCRKLGFLPELLPGVALQETLLNAAQAERANRVRVSWERVVRPPLLCTANSRKRIETPLGKRVRFWLGKEDDTWCSTHALIVGQSGSGKSRLLDVIITGLAARYAPSQLRFVLIGGTRSSDFQVYRPLPHAELICVRASAALAAGVVADAIEEMDARYDGFQQASAIDFEDFRRQTGTTMPRLVIIIDSYDEVFSGDNDVALPLLLGLLEGGRAVGIHLILSTAYLHVPKLPTRARAYFQCRIALSVGHDQILGQTVFGPEGGAIIEGMAPVGELVLNDHSGNDRHNIRGAVAEMRGEGQEQDFTNLLNEIKGAVPTPSFHRFFIDGQAGVSLKDNAAIMDFRAKPPDADFLQDLARRPMRAEGFGLREWSVADQAVPLWLGAAFATRGHVVVPLRRTANQNLLVLGPTRGVRAAMLASALAALRAMPSPEKIIVSLVDGSTVENATSSMIATGLEVLEGAGATARCYPPEGISDLLSRLMDQVSSLPAGGDGFVRLLVLNDPDHLPMLHVHPTGLESILPLPAAHLRGILHDGPVRNCHVILSGDGVDSISQILHPTRELYWFTHRVVQQLSEFDSFIVMDSLMATKIESLANGNPTAALAVDLNQGAERGRLFRSYVVDRDPTVEITQSALRSFFDDLFGLNTSYLGDGD
jgi:S-DNA-T family DNA segregation ATPase FtsK/SpoIIIE